MQSLTDEQFLDSENFWKKDFGVRFIKCNPDGSEEWMVIHKNTPAAVFCNSMLCAFKIANTAMERKMMMKLSIDHSNILSKAGELLGFPTASCLQRMTYKKYYGGWNESSQYNVKDYFGAKSKRKKNPEKELSFTIKYHCCKCGKYSLELLLDDEEVTECYKCGGPVTRL